MSKRWEERVIASVYAAHPEYTRDAGMLRLRVFQYDGCWHYDISVRICQTQPIIASGVGKSLVATKQAASERARQLADNIHNDLWRDR